MAKNEKDYINEIAELKAEIDAFQMSENEANEIIAELEAKNKRLKEEVKEIGSAFIKKGDYARELEKQLEFDSRYNDMQAELDYGERIIEKYKNVLQEIKAIAKDNIIGCEGDKCELADEILQKITKAEEE